MDFYKLVLLIIIAAAELLPGKKSDNETSMITCKPIKEGQTAYLDAKLFLNSYEYIISKGNDLSKIVCKTNACIIATQGFRVILNTTFNKEDNSTQVIVWFKNSFDFEGNWSLQSNINNDKRQISFRYEYCKVFESIKDISCENITDFEGLKINCRSSKVPYAFKCFFELQINENYQQIDESDCSLRIAKINLTVGTYNVTVTYYPENYPEMKFKLGTSKEFIFEKYGPTIELDGCLTTIEEQKQILCRCTNKTEVKTMFWSSTDGNSSNSSLLNITAQKGRYTYFCSATDQYGIFNSSIVYEFNVTAYPKIKILTINDKKCDVLINKSEEIIIKCEAENQENIKNYTIELIKNNKRLTPTNITGLIFEWKKEKAECGDSGLYKCLVTDNITKYNNVSQVQLTILFCEQMGENGWLLIAIALSCVAILLILMSSAVFVYKRNKGNFHKKKLWLNSLREITNQDIYNCNINTHSEKCLNKSKLAHYEQASVYVN